MGTSVSFRAPPTPRWQAFVTALEVGAPLARVRSELFNAGDEWQTWLAGPPVAAFAAKLVDAFDSLPNRLRRAERVDAALASFLIETRGASLRDGFTPALGLAERAFGTTLLRTVAGEQPLAELSAEAAAERWEAARGERAGNLASRYLGELLAQYAQHAVNREAGRLLAGLEPRKVSVTRRTAEELARAAAQVAQGVRIDTDDPAELRDRWSLVVGSAFDNGRRLPQGQH